MTTFVANQKIGDSTYGLECIHFSSWAGAQAGTGTLATAGSANIAGWTQDTKGAEPPYTIYENFPYFDLSSLSSGATVTAATLSWYWDTGNTNWGGTDALECWAGHPAGEPPVTGDWVTMASLNANVANMLATYHRTGSEVNGSYVNFTNNGTGGSLMLAQIQAAMGGLLKLMITTTQARGVTPTSVSEGNVYSFPTSDGPMKLSITYGTPTAPSGWGEIL